jgi:hypothetical protein
MGGVFPYTKTEKYRKKKGDNQITLDGIAFGAFAKHPIQNTNEGEKNEGI